MAAERRLGLLVPARTESAGAQAGESRNLVRAQTGEEGWAREEAVRCSSRTPSMRVRGARWLKVRQPQKEREKELLTKPVVSDLGFDGNTVDGEGGEQDRTAATKVPAFSLVYTSKSAGPRPEIDASSARDHWDDQKEKILKGTITTAVSPNRGVQQRSLDHFTEAEEGRAAKRKHLPISLSNKSKVLVTSGGTNTSGSIKETFSIEEAVAQNPLSNVVDQSMILEDYVPNVLLNQPGRASLPKMFHPAQSVSEKEHDHEAHKEVAVIPVHNTEEINSEAMWEWIQKLHDELVSLSEPTPTKLLEQANKLVMENKHLKDEQIVLLQQVKDQKQMIDELSKQNMALVRKCTEVDCFKETAQLIKDKEELQCRMSQANELLKLMTDILGAAEA